MLGLNDCWEFQVTLNVNEEAIFQWRKCEMQHQAAPAHQCKYYRFLENMRGSKMIEENSEIRKCSRNSVCDISRCLNMENLLDEESISSVLNRPRDEHNLPMKAEPIFSWSFKHQWISAFILEIVCRLSYVATNQLGTCTCKWYDEIIFVEETIWNKRSFDIISISARQMLRLYQSPVKYEAICARKAGAFIYNIQLEADAWTKRDCRWCCEYSAAGRIWLALLSQKSKWWHEPPVWCVLVWL